MPERCVELAEVAQMTNFLGPRALINLKSFRQAGNPGPLLGHLNQVTIKRGTGYVGIMEKKMAATII